MLVYFNHLEGMPDMKWNFNRVVGLVSLWLIFSPLAYGVSAELLAESETIFAQPHDIEVGPGGRFIYVADKDNNTIQILDAMSLKATASFGKLHLNHPHDIGFDKNGLLYVADTENNRIAVFRGSGTNWEFERDVIAQMAKPEGIDFDQNNTMYVANTALNEVTLYNNANKFTARIAKGPDETVEIFSNPHDVEIGFDSLIYISDPGNNRLKIYNPDLSLKKIIGGKEYQFSEPKYLAVDHFGWIYVADQKNNKIKILNKNHQLVAQIPDNLSGPKKTQLNNPEGIAVNGKHLWVSDTGNNRILLFEVFKIE